VIIDGVLDPVSWANEHSYKWLSHVLTDTEKLLHNFYEACADAGANRCALASAGSTADSISEQVDGFLDKLYEHPMAVPDATRPGPLTASMVQVLLFTSLYSPRSWPAAASDLAAAMNGNGTAIVNRFLHGIELDPTVPAQTSSSTDAVICTDGPDFDGMDLEDVMDDILDEVIRSQQQTSRHFSTWSIVPCHHWKARASERFTGPFNHTLRHEMLIIGNTADPVTPVVNARKVNGLLSNSSRLIVQDGSGHCSVAMTSVCTFKAIKGYLLRGELPPDGLVCSTDERLFPPSSPEETDNGSMLWLKASAEAYSEEDLHLLASIRELGKRIEPFLSSFTRHRNAW